MILDHDIKLTNEDAKNIAKSTVVFTTKEISKRISKYTPDSSIEPQPWTEMAKTYRK